MGKVAIHASVDPVDDTVLMDATSSERYGAAYMLPQHEVVQVAAGGKEDAVWCLFLTAEGRLLGDWHESGRAAAFARLWYAAAVAGLVS